MIPLAQHKPLWPFRLNRNSAQAENLLLWLPFAPPFASYHRDFARHEIGSAAGGLDWKAMADLGLVPDFDGSNDYINFSGLHFPSPITVAFWVRFPLGSFNTSQSRFICGEWENAGNTWLIYLWGGATGGVPGMTIFSSGNLFFQFPTSLQDDWHHVVIESAGAGYLDGVQQSMTGSAQTWGSTANSFQIGKWTSNYLQAQLADFRIYAGSVGAALARAMYHPATRWELYGKLDHRSTHLTPDNVLSVDPASLVVTGEDIGLLYNQRLEADPALFTVDGQNIGMFLDVPRLYHFGLQSSVDLREVLDSGLQASVNVGSPLDAEPLQASVDVLKGEGTVARIEVVSEILDSAR